MKRTLLLCCVCFLTLFSNAQNQTATKPSTTTEFSNPSLNTQVSKIKEKENQIAAATTASRAQMNALTEELRLLKEEYVKMLSTELSKTTDPELKNQLEAEIAIYTQLPKTQTR